MASVTIPPALSSHAHSPLTSIDVPSTASFESPSPQPSPSPELNSQFAFPERMSADAPDRTAAMAIPSEGGSHRRRHSRQNRPSLPDFSFNPGATFPDSSISPQPSPSPKTHPILEEMAANSRNVRHGRPSPLPAFSFNPGASDERQRTPSPTKAGFGEGAERQSAHRRGGSELVGGDGTSAILSTSPVRSDIAPPRCPPGGRGHRHKRSGALSVAEVDLSSIIKANAIAKHRTGSAPSTPADLNSPTFFDHNKAIVPGSPNSPKSALATPPASPRRGSVPGAFPKPRVAFSDTVSEIPRPLSLISSETEGSTSTVRASHSASGSVASIPSPPRPSSSSSQPGNDSPQRPASAGKSSVFSREELPSPPGSPQRPLSASGTYSSTASSSESPPSKKHFWCTPTEDQYTGILASDCTEDVATETDLTNLAPSGTSGISRQKTSPERKASIKRRRVRTWTGGIFSRRSKHRGSRTKGRRTPTPPLADRSPSDFPFDNDDGTVVIEDTTSTPTRLPLLDTQPHASPANSGTRSFEIEDDVISPVIDLDAALGPFGSEERFQAASTSRAAWRRLHSAQSLGDPSNVYHRRAESAPHLPPVNRNSFGFNRMGSNPSMSEEVFDEEEEDDYLARKRAGAESPETMKKAPVDCTTEQGAQPCDHNLEATTPITENSQAGADDVIEIVEDPDGIGHSGDRSSGSTILPPITDDMMQKRPASVPMDFAFPTTKGAYASSAEGRSIATSAVSSPEADHISFDSQGPRHARYLQQPSNDNLRPGSTDDVPSLTDSVSTATGHVPRISSSGNTWSSADQRSASFSGLATWSSVRASKRASLVSLTRLLPGSSHGERNSKLRFGQSAEDGEEQKEKRKSNRLSRIMTFWKQPKDKA